MPRGQAWKKQAPGEQLQEHTGPLLRCAVAVKRHNLLWIDKMFLFLSYIFFLSSFSLLSFSWRPYFPSVHFLFSYFFSLLSLSLLSSSSPLTSSTVPVLPPFAPPARIDFVLVNLELRGAQGRDNGHWAEVNRAGRGYFLHSMVVISSAESFLEPPRPHPTTTSAACTPWPSPLHALISFRFFFFLNCFLLFLSFSLNLQDLSKYHAGLQTGRWQTIKGRCRLIISSALWLTSISLQRHWAAAGRSKNMQSGGLLTSFRFTVGF